MGHEFYDRYYKLGSTVDITCQVSQSYLATLPTSHAEKNSLSNSNNNNQEKQKNIGNKDKLKSIQTAQNIIWKKDGEDIPKDIKLNFRYVNNTMYIITIVHSISEINRTRNANFHYKE